MAADVANSLKSWSSTESSNSPSGSTAISTNLDDNLRMIQKVVRDAVAAQDTIASASTTDLGTKDAGTLTVSGTTTITSFGTVSAGIRKRLIFSGALTLTHNATSLILPSAANITTAAGDTCEAESLGSGNWRVISYQKANGNPLSVSALTFADGSNTAPSIAFTNDSDLGFYRVGANTLAAAGGGGTVGSGGFSVQIGTAGIASQLGGSTRGLIVDYGGGASNDAAMVLDSANGYCGARRVSGESYLVARDLCSSKPLLELTSTSASTAGTALTITYGNVSPTTASNVIEITMNPVNLIWRVRQDGATFADGAYSGSGADYAEAFLYVGDEPQPGDTVVLVGDKVRKALYGEVPIGVISEKPCAIGDAKLLDQGAVPVGLIGKLRINQGCPIAPSWINLAGDLYLVR